MLRHTVLDYEPDLVLLLMFLGNDIGDNSRSINPGQIKPYYRIEDDRLVLDTSFRSDPRFLAAKSFSTRIKASLINSSRILQLLNHGYSRWKRRAGPKPNVGIGLDPAVYRKPESRDWEDAWQVTEKLLEAFVKQCQHQGAESLIVTGSIPIQVHPLASVRDQFQREHPIDSLFYPNDRIRRFCADREIRLFQLARRFRQDVDASPAPIYYHGFSNTVMGTGHWNERGHQRAAELLSEYLQATLLKSKPHEGHGKIRQ